MRVVTRPDFDGVVCAVILVAAGKIDQAIKWVEPSAMQNGQIDIRKGDIVANLPYDPRCSLWFDHHATNRIETPFSGGFKIAPSAAGLVFAYYRDRLSHDFSELVEQADKIDSANLSMQEVREPQQHPYLLLSMTLKRTDPTDPPYWDHLVDLLLKRSIADVMADNEVSRRSKTVIQRNKEFQRVLEENTRFDGQVSVTDLRTFHKSPGGNRFLSYAIFPQTVVSVKIRYDYSDREKVVISVGHSIFNRNCNVHAGTLLASYGGGGHKGAAACRVPAHKADQYLHEIVAILSKNEPL